MLIVTNSISTDHDKVHLNRIRTIGCICHSVVQFDFELDLIRCSHREPLGQREGEDAELIQPGLVRQQRVVLVGTTIAKIVHPFEERVINAVGCVRVVHIDEEFNFFLGYQRIIPSSSIKNKKSS